MFKLIECKFIRTSLSRVTSSHKYMHTGELLNHNYNSLNNDYNLGCPLGWRVLIPSNEINIKATHEAIITAIWIVQQSEVLNFSLYFSVTIFGSVGGWSLPTISISEPHMRWLLHNIIQFGCIPWDHALGEDNSLLNLGFPIYGEHSWCKF